jgi:hypothetical protein
VVKGYKRSGSESECDSDGPPSCIGATVTFFVLFVWKFFHFVMLYPQKSCLSILTLMSNNIMRNFNALSPCIELNLKQNYDNIYKFNHVFFRIFLTYFY